MSISHTHVNRIPRWSVAVPVAGLALAASLIGNGTGELPLAVLILAPLLLLATVFAAVHHAEVLALRLGEPVGSIVLALAVTVIELALIVSLMLAGKQGVETLARDTVYATIMLILSGVIGICLLLGGVRYHAQRFRLDSAVSALSVLGTMAVLSLVLPVFTRTTAGPTFAPVQLISVGLVSLLLYATFLFVQTVRHRDYFAELAEGADPGNVELPGNRTSLISLVSLLIALVGVVLLAKLLSPVLESSIHQQGLPQSFVGVIIAAIVLLPESVAAINAARLNRLQVSLNLALGSSLATIGLTIPLVAFLSLYLQQPIVLGLSDTETVLLLLALFISGITLTTGRTTILQGAVHFGIFIVFLVMAAFP